MDFCVNKLLSCACIFDKHHVYHVSLDTHQVHHVSLDTAASSESVAEAFRAEPMHVILCSGDDREEPFTELLKA